MTFGVAEVWLTVTVKREPAPAPPAPDAPNSARFAKPETAQTEGPVLVTENVSYALPAAIPPELADAFNTPVEHDPTAVVVVEVEVAGTVVVVVVVEVEVVVGVEEPIPQAATSIPATRSKRTREVRCNPVRLTVRNLNTSSSYQVTTRERCHPDQLKASASTRPANAEVGSDPATRQRSWRGGAVMRETFTSSDRRDQWRVTQDHERDEHDEEACCCAR